jgi:hypothetical protein
MNDQDCIWKSFIEIIVGGISILIVAILIITIFYVIVILPFTSF